MSSSSSVTSLINFTIVFLIPANLGIPPNFIPGPIYYRQDSSVGIEKGDLFLNAHESSIEELCVSLTCILTVTKTPTSGNTELAEMRTAVQARRLAYPAKKENQRDAVSF
jgi:hypothetical protein